MNASPVRSALVGPRGGSVREGHRSGRCAGCAVELVGLLWFSPTEVLSHQIARGPCCLQTDLGVDPRRIQALRAVKPIFDAPDRRAAGREHNYSPPPSASFLVGLFPALK